MGKDESPIKIITVMLILLGLLIGILAGFGTVQSARDDRQDTQIEKNRDTNGKIYDEVHNISINQAIMMRELKITPADTD